MGRSWPEINEGASNHPAAEGIKAFYDHVAREPVPPKFLELLRQLREAAPSAQ